MVADSCHISAVICIVSSMDGSYVGEGTTVARQNNSHYRLCIYTIISRPKHEILVAGVLLILDMLWKLEHYMVMIIHRTT